MSVAAEQKTKTLKNYVGGSWVDVTGAELHDVINPATGAKVDFAAGSTPRGVVFDGNNVWITNVTVDKVSKMVR